MFLKSDTWPYPPSAECTMNNCTIKSDIFLSYVPKLPIPLPFNFWLSPPPLSPISYHLIVLSHCAFLNHHIYYVEISIDTVGCHCDFLFGQRHLYTYTVHLKPIWVSLLESTTVKISKYQKVMTVSLCYYRSQCINTTHIYVKGFTCCH